MKTVNKEKEWSLIVDKTPLKGSLNMAIDDYLFQSLTDIPETYLRFYTWEKPTASLGYSQRVSKVLDAEFCRNNGVDVVRRMTGGKLVLHHNEATYSVCSSDTEIFSSRVVESYSLISEALMRGLEKMGLEPCLADAPPDFYTKGNLPCFSYPARNEVEVQGKKIIGSAQKRVKFKFIQHGSIPLEEEDELLKSVTSLAGRGDDIRMISLQSALQKKVNFEWVVEYLKEGFSEYFGVDLKPKKFAKQEMKAILKIQKERYENDAWTYRWGQTLKT